ncbi:Outer membrane protein OmpA [Azospirillum sp. RU38E]|nr:Outer membrane protein OmpA [Azospirillum sp. RU38E]SNT09451.1 Outer membrane protein OmpA [Azospirillum sp. RU37A]
MISFKRALICAGLFGWLAVGMAGANDGKLSKEEIRRRLAEQGEACKLPNPPPDVHCRGMGVDIGVSSPPVVNERLRVELQITFDYNSDVLTAEAKRVLDELGEILASESFKQSRFEIAGHTDAKGTDDYNRRLSKRRATAARAYLVEKFSIPANRLEVQGYGANRLAKPTDPLDGANRRVEIFNVGQVM